MTDLTFTRSGETMLTMIEGQSSDGLDFVDAWIQEPMTVVDSGRILIPTDTIPALEEAAMELDLSIERVEGI